MLSPALFVRDVRKVFRKRSSEQWALKGVSFSVANGETYGLLGPNGSGKSTLIRILSTLLLPDGGEIEVLGYRLPEREREVRRNIGRVSVDAAFYKKLSARENLVYSALLYGIDQRTAERKSLEILGQLGFPSTRFNDPLEEMSRGTQQKISIARALLVDPPVLLLDEPTTGLDPKSKRDVQEFIEDLRRRKGTTVLLTTHDMAEAERLCDRLGLLAHGRLVAEGTANEIKEAAGTEGLEDAFLKLSGEAFEKEEAEA